jgi:hypothetical protein
MSPFEVLYGRKCTTPISWDNLVDRIMVGLEILQEMERMAKRVQKNLKEAQDRHKIYEYIKGDIKNSKWERTYISKPKQGEAP